MQRRERFPAVYLKKSSEKMKKARRITRFRRSVRAISPVISTLLMIAIAVVASLVAYAWVMSYMGSTTHKVGNAILIQSIAPGANGMEVYVQNVGQSAVTFDPAGSVYVNNALVPLSQSAFDKTTLTPGDTAVIQTGYAWTDGLNVKIVTTDGTFTQSTNSYYGGSATSPVSSFTMSTSNPNVGQTVTFTDTSTQGTGTINQWSWSFGDGATSTTQNPTYAYTTPGTKTVTLTVTDANGQTSTTTTTLTVNDYIPPVASFNFAPTAPTIGETVTFTDTSTKGTGTINQWSWNFGDGTTATVQNPTHAYSNAGQETVTLTVTDTDGKSNTATQNVNVDFNAPTADFTMSSSTPNVGQSVTFTDASVKGSGTINQWAWTFGDGGTSNVQNPTHAYSTPGAETITLKVTDTNGETSTATHSLTVNDYISPTASFTFAPTTPNIGQTVTFTDTSTKGSGTINQWAWNFGNGATPTTSTTQNPTCAFSTSGDQTVKLTITDTNGKQSTTTTTVHVNIPPTAAFTYSATNLLVNFDGSGSSDSDGTIASYAWTFGDTNTGTGVTTSHTYASAGTYTVQLTVTDNGGATNYIDHQVTVTSPQQAPTVPAPTLNPLSWITLGQSVTASLTVSGSAGTPTGTLTFYVSTDSGSTWNTFGSNGGVKSLSGGSATSDSYTPAAAGNNYRFKAVYSGDTNYLGATSTTTALTVYAVQTFALDGASTFTTSGSTMTITLTTSSPNDVLYLSWVGNAGGQSITGISSSGTSLWTQRARISANNDNSQFMETWYAISSASGAYSITITVNGSSASGCSAAAFGISGAATASPFDGNPSTNYGPSASAASGSITTHNANDFVIGAMGVENSQVGLVANSPFTMITHADATSRFIADARDIVSTTGTYTPSFAWNSNNKGTWGIIADAVKKGP